MYTFYTHFNLELHLQIVADYKTMIYVIWSTLHTYTYNIACFILYFSKKAVS